MIATGHHRSIRTNMAVCFAFFVLFACSSELSAGVLDDLLGDVEKVIDDATDLVEGQLNEESSEIEEPSLGESELQSQTVAPEESTPATAASAPLAPKQSSEEHVAQATPPIPAIEEEDGKHLATETQALLNKLGYDAGPVDGLPGSNTRAAVRAFQKHQGLEVNGHISPDLLAALRQVSQQQTTTDTPPTSSIQAQSGSGDSIGDTLSIVTWTRSHGYACFEENANYYICRREYPHFNATATILGRSTQNIPLERLNFYVDGAASNPSTLKPFIADTLSDLGLAFDIHWSEPSGPSARTVFDQSVRTGNTCLRVTGEVRAKGDWADLDLGVFDCAAAQVGELLVVDSSGLSSEPRQTEPLSGQEQPAITSEEREAAFYDSGTFRWQNVDEAFMDGDMSVVVRLLDIGCRAEVKDTCFYLGDFYREGDGVPKDEEAAIRYFEVGCSRGEPDPCERLGRPVPLVESSVTKSVESQEAEQPVEASRIESSNQTAAEPSVNTASASASQATEVASQRDQDPPDQISPQSDASICEGLLALNDATYQGLKSSGVVTTRQSSENEIVRIPDIASGMNNCEASDLLNQTSQRGAIFALGVLCQIGACGAGQDPGSIRRAVAQEIAQCTGLAPNEAVARNQSIWHQNAAYGDQGMRPWPAGLRDVYLIVLREKPGQRGCEMSLSIGLP